MEYRAPKLESPRYEPQPVTIPPDRHYWGLRFTIQINVPEPEVNNFTGPRGRLKWISEVCLSWHNVSPMAEEESSRTTSWKLHRKGWVGLSTAYMSPYEEKRILKFVSEKGRDQVYKGRTYTLESDARPGDIGSFPERGSWYYFATKELRDEFLGLLESMPKRTQVMYVDRSRMTPACHLILRGKNWIIFRGEDADLLSFEDTIPVTALMTIKLIAGVAKPT